MKRCAAPAIGLRGPRFEAFAGTTSNEEPSGTLNPL
jgi:hypothetical protein